MALYTLKGEVIYTAEFSLRERFGDITENFEAINEEAAINRAKEVVRMYHDQFGRVVVFGIWAVLSRKNGRPFWTMMYLIFASTAPVPNYFREERLPSQIYEV